MSRKRWAILVIGLGLLGSQAGHLLAYQLMFGAAAGQVQSSGTHAYFPMLAKIAVGAAVAALIVGLLIVGLARILSGRRIRSGAEPSYLSVLAFLFCIQLVAFAAQEVGEALIAGAPIATAPQLLLWGTLGQLPVAALAALALQWLGVRVEASVGAIRELIRTTIAKAPAPVPVAMPVFAPPDRALLQSRVAVLALPKRGPPSLLIAS